MSPRRLINILKTSTDPNILAIAANDIGQYVKHYERGKKYVLPLGVCSLLKLIIPVIGL